MTFTAAFATPDGRHQLRLIDIHIDKGRIDGRPDDSTPPPPPDAPRARNTSREISRFALKYPRAGYRQPHPHRRLRRGFISAKINSAAANRGEIGGGKLANLTAPVSIRAASPLHRRAGSATRPIRDTKAKLSSPQSRYLTLSDA